MFSILNLAALTITSTSMTDFTAPDALAIYSEAHGLVLTMSDNTIKCNLTQSDEYTKYLLNN
jgi:hypothetical protein